jgi:uncharacterized membrane protein
MKDQFGNDWTKETMDKDKVKNDSAFNERDRNMSDMERNNRERVINVQGDKAYTDRERDMTDRDMSGMERNDNDKVLVGIFETVHEANNVIIRLKEIGYRENDITVLARDKDKMDRLEGDTDKMGAGAAIGGTIGGIAAALPALGLLAIPGIGPILAAGPIAVILGGVVAGGVAGGLIGAFAEMGINETDARQYERQLSEGKIIVLVENRESMREEVFNTYRQNNNFNDIYPPRF